MWVRGHPVKLFHLTQGLCLHLHPGSLCSCAGECGSLTLPNHSSCSQQPSRSSESWSNPCQNFSPAPSPHPTKNELRHTRKAEKISNKRTKNSNDNELKQLVAQEQAASEEEERFHEEDPAFIWTPADMNTSARMVFPQRTFCRLM